MEKINSENNLSGKMVSASSKILSQRLPKNQTRLIIFIVNLVIWSGIGGYYLGRNSLPRTCPSYEVLTGIPSIANKSQSSSTAYPDREDSFLEEISADQVWIENTVAADQKNPASDWKTYFGEGFTFRYPGYLGEFFKSKSFVFSSRTKQEIVDEYQKFKEGGCPPGVCGRFIENPDLLQRQFSLLSELTTFSDCVLTTNYTAKIKKEFILFSKAIQDILEVSGIKIDNFCGLKIIDKDGYDVFLGNINYTVGLIKDDKVISISLKLFPLISTSERMNKLWSYFGCDINGGCSPNSRESDYFINFSPNDRIPKDIISVYDQVLSTFKFTQ